MRVCGGNTAVIGVIRGVTRRSGASTSSIVVCRTCRWCESCGRGTPVAGRLREACLATGLTQEAHLLCGDECPPHSTHTTLTALPCSPLSVSLRRMPPRASQSLYTSQPRHCTAPYVVALYSRLQAVPLLVGPPQQAPAAGQPPPGMPQFLQHLSYFPDLGGTPPPSGSRAQFRRSRASVPPLLADLWCQDGWFSTSSCCCGLSGCPLLRAAHACCTWKARSFSSSRRVVCAGGRLGKHGPPGRHRPDAISLRAAWG